MAKKISENCGVFFSVCDGNHTTRVAPVNRFLFWLFFFLLVPYYAYTCVNENADTEHVPPPWTGKLWTSSPIHNFFFQRRVLVRGHCCVWYWLTDFGGVKLCCFSLSRSAIFKDVWPMKPKGSAIPLFNPFSSGGFNACAASAALLLKTNEPTALVFRVHYFHFYVGRATIICSHDYKRTML